MRETYFAYLRCPGFSYHSIIGVVKKVVDKRKTGAYTRDSTEAGTTKTTQRSKETYQNDHYNKTNYKSHYQNSNS